METDIITGIFHFTAKSLTNVNYIENRFRARLLRKIDDDSGTPIEFILPENEKIFIGETKEINIRVASFDFIREFVIDKTPLQVCFSRSMHLGTFHPK